MARISNSLVFGGNWKASMTPASTRAFMRSFLKQVTSRDNLASLKQSEAKIIISPPAACLESARAELNEKPFSDVIKLGVQDPWAWQGAYTGATTLEAALDPSIRAEYAVIGHSETREPWRIILNALNSSPLSDTDKMVSRAHLDSFILGELKIESPKPASFRIALDTIINRLVRETLLVNITPILCVGETLAEREAGHTEKVVLSQLMLGLQGLTPQDIAKIIVAYEPVWAIGTGKTASPEEAEEVHAAIDSKLVGLTDDEDHGIPIIYGGSMNEKNVAELVSKPHISGGLIGNASLKPDQFMQLILKGIFAF